VISEISSKVEQFFESISPDDMVIKNKKEGSNDDDSETPPYKEEGILNRR
jgi:hypothetical protein